MGQLAHQRRATESEETDMPPTSRPTARIAALAAVAVWLTACGSEPTAGGPVGPSDSLGSTSTTEVLSTTTTSTTTSSSTTTTLVPDECEQDRHTLEVAIEAFFAGEGRVPDAELELVDTGMLLAESGSYDLVDGEIVRVVGAPCDYEPIRTGQPLTTDRVFATLAGFTGRPDGRSGLCARAGGHRGCRPELHQS